ncbi:Crp/Fnr family transcriptional regulator [Hymenobacter aquaticus]|uniref:Crp/Fnr family transcriptional regulator n=1 Tax=Hymenobacter aquaticus TaxID=1867101 RepID=A0A4Z0PV43_9BACT|nr:Crp/Fnr family transcriptional regulator [Hymenobacter aquaticus]TGE20753.1 Crp/Fnr family transcriptional regulator [Hymenobacter aquaticus]
MFNQFFETIKRFVPLSTDDQAAITAAFRVCQLRKKETLLLQGSMCMSASYIVKGLLRVYHADPQDNQFVLKFATENEWAVDLGSFFNQQAAIVTIEAVEATKVLYTDHRSLLALFGQVPAFERYVRLIQQQALVDMQQRLLSVMRQTADQRYLQFIMTYPALVQRLPQKQIASYLGISPEFLSKLRGQMSRGATRHAMPFLAQA